jgi:hypothetical protein
MKYLGAFAELRKATIGFVCWLCMLALYVGFVCWLLKANREYVI